MASRSKTTRKPTDPPALQPAASANADPATARPDASVMASLPQLFGNERAQKVSERVARSLADFIVERDLRAGDSLPNERAMTESLGVGRGTLREALRLLETQGLILMRPGPGGGPVVREQRPEDLRNSTSLIFQSMRVPFEHVIEARSSVEPEAARLAAVRRTEDELRELRFAARRIVEAVDDPTLLRPRYSEFHSILGAATHNDVLRVWVATLRDISETFEAQVVDERAGLEATAQNHDRLVQALEARDGDMAHGCMSKHLGDYRARFAREYPALLRQPVRWSTA